jgi:hypothetical protein
LRVETVVPAANDELCPAFVVARNRTRPGAPSKFVFGRKILIRDTVPDSAAVGGKFNALRPASTARVGPAY